MRITVICMCMVMLIAAGCTKKKPAPQTSPSQQESLADHGNIEAAHQMGMRYEDGIGVPKDEAKAVKYYTIAAEKGYTPSQFMLGNCYVLGKGVTKDKEKAIAWFEKAAAGTDPKHSFFHEQAKERLSELKLNEK